MASATLPNRWWWTGSRRERRRGLFRRRGSGCRRRALTRARFPRFCRPERGRIPPKGFRHLWIGSRSGRPACSNCATGLRDRERSDPGILVPPARRRLRSRFRCRRRRGSRQRRRGRRRRSRRHVAGTASRQRRWPTLVTGLTLLAPPRFGGPYWRAKCSDHRLPCGMSREAHRVGEAGSGPARLSGGDAQLAGEPAHVGHGAPPLRPGRAGRSEPSRAGCEGRT